MKADLRRFNVMLILSFVIGFQAAVFAAVPKLCPQPQELKLRDGGEALNLSGGCKLEVVSPDAPPVAAAVERLRQRMEKVFDCSVQRQAGPTITIGIAADWTKASSKLAQKTLKEASALPVDGYILDIAEHHVWIVGKDARGTAYGVETLAQLLGDGKPIPELRISDWPDTEYRISYVGVGGKLTEWLRRRIDLVFHYKLNMIVFENGELYGMDDKKTAADVLEIFDYCRRVGIEPIPEMQSFGHGVFVLSIDPTCVEAAPWPNRRFTFGQDNIAAPTFQPHTAKIVNAGFEQGTKNTFDGWWVDGGQTVFDGAGRDGSRCVRITRKTSGMSKVGQSFACRPETRYAIEFDVKVQTDKGFSTYVEVYGEMGGNPKSGVFSGTSDWQLARFEFDSGKSTKLTIIARIQSGTGTVWFDNVTCKAVRPAELVNVVATPEMPIRVDSRRGVRYKEGQDYEVFPGDLAYPFRSDAKPWQIRRKPTGRIGASEEVLISYHWAPPGSRSYCPSSPRTQEIMKTSIQRVIRLLKPRYLHIGHDEPAAINRDTRCLDRKMIPYELFADDVKLMYGFAKQADPNVRLMMWDDAVRATYGKYLHREDIPRDIIMCLWEYKVNESPVAEQTKSFLQHRAILMTEAGYNVTCSPWYDPVNNYIWGQVVKKMQARGSDKCLGLFLTTWSSSNWTALPLCSDLMWTVSSPDHEEIQDVKELRRTLKEAYKDFPTD